MGCWASSVVRGLSLRKASDVKTKTCTVSDHGE